MDLIELCDRYRRLYVPAVCDALYELSMPEQVLPSSLRPLFPEQRIVGEAFTVEGRALGQMSWEEGIARIRSYLEVFDRLTPNSVLVSVNPPNSHVGHFGELTANSAKARGCVGVILDGNLRDIEGMRKIGFQIFYRNLSPLNAIGRWEMVASQEPVIIDAVTIHPGDIILAEFDGILVIPRGDAEQVLFKAEEIERAESEVRKELREGTSPWDSFDRHGHI